MATEEFQERRGTLLGLVGLVGLAPVLLSSRTAHSASSDKFSSTASTPAEFMAEADRMLHVAVKAGDQSFGAVVVKDGRIVGFGPSKVVTNGDPSAHAEMIAIRDAAQRLGTRDLSGATLYSTFRPCPMCEAAGFWANLDKMIHGADMVDAGRPQLRRC